MVPKRVLLRVSTGEPEPKRGQFLEKLALFTFLAFLTGITLVIVTRFRTAPKAGFGNYFDWLLVMVLYTIAATGILAEVLRLLDIASFAYPVYFIHLVLVFFLFAYAPFSKMAHLVYRTVAMVFKKHVGDDLRLAGMASNSQLLKPVRWV